MTAIPCCSGVAGKNVQVTFLSRSMVQCREHGNPMDAMATKDAKDLDRKEDTFVSKGAATVRVHVSPADHGHLVRDFYSPQHWLEQGPFGQ